MILTTNRYLSIAPLCKQLHTLNLVKYLCDNPETSCLRVLIAQESPKNRPRIVRLR